MVSPTKRIVSIAGGEENHGKIAREKSSLFPNTFLPPGFATSVKRRAKS